MKILHTLIVVLILAALSGCSSASAPSARPKNEPGTLALRNSTGAALKSVRIGEDRSVTSSSRLGQISPVLPDVTYPFVRSPNAHALPPRVRVQWTDASNHDRSAVVELGNVLKQATGGEGEALLFEIGRGGTVDARIVSAER